VKVSLLGRCAALIPPALVLLAACGSPTVCPLILELRLTVPDTTTIKVGGATIAIAGESWGGCETGPPLYDYFWSASDSTVVAVSALDSIHARIRGLKPGRAVVTPIYRTGRSVHSATSVTVVP
jgi:hypothetical protein